MENIRAVDVCMLTNVPCDVVHYLHLHTGLLLLEFDFETYVDLFSWCVCLSFLFSLYGPQILSMIFKFHHLKDRYSSESVKF